MLMLIRKFAARASRLIPELMLLFDCSGWLVDVTMCLTLLSVDSIGLLGPGAGDRTGARSSLDVSPRAPPWSVPMGPDDELRSPSASAARGTRMT